MSRLRPSADDGFTLVELLVVMVLTAMIGGVVVTSVVRSFQISAGATARVDAMASLQQAQERMTRTIREGVPQGTPHATELTVRITDGATERTVTYELQGDEVLQTETSPTGTSTRTVITGLVAGVGEDDISLFTYDRADGEEWDPSTGVDAIRRITITFIAGLDDGSSIPLTTSVFPRNSVLENQP